MEVIRFKKIQPESMKNAFDESLLGSWHVILPPCDYTACGHATDEYTIEKKEGKITCEECIDLIKYCKKIKL